MKLLILCSLLLSTASYSQSLDVNALKQFMSSKQSATESIKVGMSKKLTSKGSIKLENGTCHYSSISDQTVLRIEGSKIIILEENTFEPEDSEVCKSAGYEADEVSSLFYEDKPSLALDLADLDASAKDITSIFKQNDMVTLKLSFASEEVTLKYDFSKSSFRNLVYEKGSDYETASVDTADVDVNTLNLTNVLFCEVINGERENCVQGDFSDILF